MLEYKAWLVQTFMSRYSYLSKVCPRSKPCDFRVQSFAKILCANCCSFLYQIEFIAAFVLAANDSIIIKSLFLKSICNSKNFILGQLREHWNILQETFVCIALSNGSLHQDDLEWYAVQCPQAYMPISNARCSSWGIVHDCQFSKCISSLACFY